MNGAAVLVMLGVTFLLAASGGSRGDHLLMRGAPARPAGSDVQRDDTGAAVDDAGVVLELLAVATGTTALPDALRVVGQSVGGPVGRALTTAGTALVLGASWDEAWTTATLQAHERRRTGGTTHSIFRNGRAASRDASPRILDLVASCLRPAWEQGAAPGAALRAARDRHDREADARAAEAAERLAVQLVVPLGFCLLPAFVLLGLVPAVIALGSGLL